MKKLFAVSLLIAGLASSAFAGRLTLDCSSADGKIRIGAQGTVVTIDGQKFRPIIGFKNIELPYNDEISAADVKIVPTGNRAIISKTTGQGCRDVDVVTFAQRVKFIPLKKSFSDAYKAGFEESLICEYWNVSAPLGRSAGCQ